jgi:hypothetical protein
MGNKVGIYKLAYTGGKWIGTALTSAVYTHGVTWPWTLANSPMFPVFTSGDCLVYYDYDNTYWAAWNKSWVLDGLVRAGSRWSTDWHPPVSVCAFKGQIIACGSVVATTAPSQSRIVRWSEIGQFDFLGKTATVRKNTAGYTYAPTDDAEILLRCLPLDDAVVIYGTFATFALLPVNKPVVTFAIKPVKQVGIANPLAVGGGLKKHLVVDRYGYLWLVTMSSTRMDEVDMKRLGYREFFKDSIDTVSIVYNSMEDEFYISSGVKSYLYNDFGLTEIGKCVTSFVDYKNTQVTNELTDLVTIYDTPVGFVRPLSEQELQYATDILDFGINGIKTIESVDIGATFGLKTTAEVMIQWRNDKKGSFRDTPWKRCSPEGFVSPLVSGVELKVNLRLSTYVGIELNTINVKWKISDKRFIRGMYTNASSSNA